MKTKVYTMNNILRSVLAVSLLFTIYGCVKDDKAPLNQENLHKVVFHAGWAPETKTVLQSDGSVWWSPGDEISLFTGGGDSGGYKLTSTNTAPAASADFVGEIGDKPDNASFIAIYPYNTSNRVNGQNVYATIPQVQVAKEGTFEKNIFVSIAVSDNENLYFKNICSGIKFSVSTPGIKKVVITNKDNSTFTGEVRYNLDDGTISSGSNNTSVTVTAPNETGFETGKYYYAVIYPTTISTGFDITYYTDNTVGKYIFNGSVEFKKGVFKRVYEKDKDITFYPYSENSAKLYASELLPENVDKTKITDVSFIVNSEKTTDTSIYTDEDSNPIYFELDGTRANFYTRADVYTLDNADYLFFGWEALKELDLSNIETSSVKNMSHMFAACWSLKSIKFGFFSTENVENMRGMFSDCGSLESIDLSGFNTGKVKDMGLMFSGCSSLKTLDLSSFNTSNVEKMSGMFGISNGEGPNRQQCQVRMCSSLEFLDLHTFNTSKVKEMQFMFCNCFNLKTVNLSGWNTTNVENMQGMFSECFSLERIDLSSFDTRNVLDMSLMFGNCAKLVSLDLSNFQTPKVIYMISMFSGCRALQFLNIGNFESSRLKNATNFLNYDSNLKHLDLGTFDLSKIENLTTAFFEVANQSKYIAIRCIESSKQTLESLAPDYYYVDLNYVAFNLDYVKWVGLNEAFPEPPSDVVNPDMYYSSDYSMDKKVITLQTATIGNGVDIVIMGDAYSDRLIADGTYESDMREAIEAIFSVEPMKSFRNLFNVYMVYAVSQNEEYQGSTIFGVRPGFGVTTGDGLASLVYTTIAVHNKPLSDVATIVIGHDINAFVELGVTYIGYEWSSDEYIDYGQARSGFAFVGKWEGGSYAQTTIHEFGHLFAKLADEYVTTDEEYTSQDIENLIDLSAHTGAYKNIDFTSEPKTIKWSRFLNDSRYTNEKLGAYEGGLLCSRGVWRPTEESVMRNVLWKPGFNAPSREAIYYRIHKLAFGVDWQYDYEKFVQQDLKNIPSEPYFQSTVQNTPYPARVNKKHIFKMEKSIAPDGRKMITVIMD